VKKKKGEVYKIDKWQKEVHSVQIPGGWVWDREEQLEAAGGFQQVISKKEGNG